MPSLALEVQRGGIPGQPGATPTQVGLICSSEPVSYPSMSLLVYRRLGDTNFEQSGLSRGTWSNRWLRHWFRDSLFHHQDVVETFTSTERLCSTLPRRHLLCRPRAALRCTTVKIRTQVCTGGIWGWGIWGLQVHQ